MKGLVNFIIEQSFDDLDEQVLHHCNIHEAFVQKHHLYYTFESTGIFPGCQKIIQYIDKNIDILQLDNHKKHKVIIDSNKIYDDCFFKQLRLEITIENVSNIDGCYYAGSNDDNYEDDRWDSDKKIFNFIDIDINIPEKDIVDNSQLLEMLTHELTHAWDDYQLRVHSNKFLKDRYNGDKFIDEINKISNNLKEKYKIDKSKETKEYINKYIPHIQTILYYLENSEQHAYLATLSKELQNKKFKSANELIVYLNTKSDIYHNYKYFYKLFNDNPNSKELLLKIGFKQSTINKFAKITKHVWNKIINHIYHIVYDVVDEGCMKESVNIKVTDLFVKLWDR